MKYKIQPSTGNGWWVYTLGPRGGWKAVIHCVNEQAAQEIADVYNKHYAAGSI